MALSKLSNQCPSLPWQTKSQFNNQFPSIIYQDKVMWISSRITNGFIIEQGLYFQGVCQKIDNHALLSYLFKV